MGLLPSLLGKFFGRTVILRDQLPLIVARMVVELRDLRDSQLADFRNGKVSFDESGDNSPDAELSCPASCGAGEFGS